MARMLTDTVKFADFVC